MKEVYCDVIVTKVTHMNKNNKYNKTIFSRGSTADDVWCWLCGSLFTPCVVVLFPERHATEISSVVMKS